MPSGMERRIWTLRADNKGHHHGRIEITESPLYLELRWIPSKNGPLTLVGLFKLDLAGLLEHGFIRRDPQGSTGSDVRLRIVCDDDGAFYIQIRPGDAQLDLRS